MRIKKRYITFFIGLIILLLSSTIQKPPPKKTFTSLAPTTSVLSATTEAKLVKVIKVIDGDTIEIEGGKKVRYIGIDTPEVHHPKKPVQCYGKIAALKNKELVEGKEVRLEKDVSETDRYGRLLRFVYIDQHEATSSVALFVNDYLVRQGYARAATFPPDIRYQEQFRAAEKEARENSRGLWSSCPLLY